MTKKKKTSLVLAARYDRLRLVKYILCSKGKDSEFNANPISEGKKVAKDRRTTRRVRKLARWMAGRGVH